MRSWDQLRAFPIAVTPQDSLDHAHSTPQDQWQHNQTLRPCVHTLDGWIIHSARARSNDVMMRALNAKTFPTLPRQDQWNRTDSSYTSWPARWHLWTTERPRSRKKKKRWAQGNQILPTLISNVSMAKKIELLTMRVNLPSRRLCRRMPTRSTVAPCVFRWNWTFSQWLPCYLQVIIEKKNSCEIGPIRSAKRKSLQYSLSILLTAQTHGISGRCWRISWYQLARFL